MSGDLVLLTGATGHVGFRTLVFALKAGYQVRAAVRDQAKARKIKSKPVIQALDNGKNLTFVEVPDFLANGAFDEAAKGAKYILHVAAPIPSDFTGSITDEEAEATMVGPAVQGALHILEAAKASATVKRIVVTSSVVALFPPKYFFHEAPQGPLPPETRTEPPPKPYGQAMVAYFAAKTVELNETEAWMAREQPGFDIIHVHPSFVLGRNDMVETVDEFKHGTNVLAITPALGWPDELRSGGSVHLDDVARVHIGALDPKVKGNQSFITNTVAPWDQTTAIVEREFPDAVKSGVFPNNGYVKKVIDAPFDGSKTEETFGFKYLPFDEQVKSVAGHYMELTAKA